MAAVSGRNGPALASIASASLRAVASRTLTGGGSMANRSPATLGSPAIAEAVRNASAFIPLAVVAVGAGAAAGAGTADGGASVGWSVDVGGLLAVGNGPKPSSYWAA